jgi:FMN phosphatase YigB (HAD superfamily)
VVVSFDLFGTLVDADRPIDPARAVAAELAARGVDVPEGDEWADAYRTPHVDAPDGAEVPLPAHVAAALASLGVGADGADPDGGANVVRRAVVAAFDPVVDRRPGARAAVDGARAAGHRIGLLSNCAVPELVGRTLARADLPPFDAVVSSVGCGWRKPDPRAFATVAGRLDAAVSDLVHVGDDPWTDGGVVDAGGRFVDVRDVALAALPGRIGPPAEAGSSGASAASDAPDATRPGADR